MKKRYLFKLILFMIFLISCQSKDLKILVANTDKDSLVNYPYHFYVNDTLVLSDSLQYSIKTPSYNKFILKGNKISNTFSFKVLGKLNSIIKDTVINGSDTNIFISFSYDANGEVKVFLLSDSKKILLE